MVSQIVSWFSLAAALGAGLIGGVFFAFSSFVLPALARLPFPQGLRAMQSINVVVLNRSFLGVFVGTGLMCAALCVDGVLRGSAPGARLRLAGGLLYVVGSLLVTRACNIPWNNVLATLSAHSSHAARSWRRFVAFWGYWNHVRAAASFAAAAVLTLSLNGCTRYWECAPPDAARLQQLPERLSASGLFDEREPTRLAAGVLEFAPQFELWSDGASKRRFISLPAGGRIDGSDLDNWRFPTGTALWKEFTVDGVRVETRLLRKLGPGDEDWATQSYVWLADGSDAVATPRGATNVLGTAHDVPAAGECVACHGGRKSFVLGFSALQLSYDAAPGRVDLESLIASSRLEGAPSAPLRVPGDETARAALGYVHANCGHCHNQDRPAAADSRCYDPDNALDFWLTSERSSDVEATPFYRSGRGAAFYPGAPSESRMVALMSARALGRQMPPLGTKAVDRRGLELMRHFIAELR